MKYPIPHQLVAAINGMLVVLVTIMFIFALIHLKRLYESHRNSALMRYWTVPQTLRYMYWQNKPSIAWAVVGFFMLSRFTLSWYLSWHAAHYTTDNAITINGVPLFIAINLGLAWGILCWIRNVCPYNVKNWQWVLVLIAAMAFGIVTSL